jgi:hypothetical protein
MPLLEPELALAAVPVPGEHHVMALPHVQAAVGVEVRGDLERAPMK